jgi:aspartyl-tRNA(Asn)/glutamyl-tRNA(Gln) amidotransferase subunit A
MSSLAFCTIRELQVKLARKEISTNDILTATLKRFAQHDERLGSTLEVFDKDSILKDSATTGMLAGIPGILKDNIAQQGRALTCASRVLQGFTSTYDATASARLKKQGALLVGRANMDEFAMGSSTETSAYHKTKNPWDLTRVPGGSSGGSIAAVAAGFVPWALGSDTGGSVRQPAALCGIVGLKPTYGLVSRYGLVAYGSSLDQIGVATRTVYDNALVLSAIAGHDTHDATSLPVNPTDYTQYLDGTIKPGLRVGVVENALEAQGNDPEIIAATQAALAVMEKLGAKISRITLPTMDYSAAVYFILSRAEAASNLARFDGVRYGARNEQAQSLAQLYAQSRKDGFGAEVKRRILIGNYVLSVGHADEYYNNARNVRDMMRNEFMAAFKDVDLLVLPTSPGPAWTIGAFDRDTLQMDLQDYYTCPMSLIGIPAISVPCGFTATRLPLGLQLVGPHLSEGLLYQTAHAYEQATDWHKHYPQGFE